MPEAHSLLSTLFSDAVCSSFRAVAQKLANLEPTDDLAACSDDVLNRAKEHVLQAVSSEIASFLWSLNARANCASLVRELLADILAYLPIHDRFSATEVCQHWRTVALNAPYIWADMSGFGLVSPRLTLALQRARSVPIRLAFELSPVRVTYNPRSSTVAIHPEDVRTKQAVAFLICLSQRMAQVTSLHIKVYGAGMSRCELHDALSQSAPLLEFFRLEFETPNHQLRSDLFAGSAPRLHTVELLHVLPPTDATSALHAVRRLRLRTALGLEVDFAVLFMNLPHLAELEFDAPPQATISSNIAATSASSLSVLVPRLRSLRLPQDSSALMLLPHFRCSRVALAAPHPGVLETLLATTLSPSRMVVVSDSTGSAFLGARTDAGALRLTRDAFMLNAGVFGTAVLAHLSALVTDTRTWAAVRGRVRQTVLSRLKYLHVVVYVQEGLKGRCQRLPEWICAPELDVLRISVVAVPESLARCGHDVSSAIDLFVQLVAPRALKFVEFDNARVQNFQAGGYVRRQSATPLEPFLSRNAGRFARWDDWLENALASIPDV